MTSGGVSIIDLMSDRELLGASYAGPSWETWKTALSAAYGMPLSDDQRAVFRGIAGDREPPQRQVQEFIAAVGRGGGKDSAAAAIATLAAIRDYRPYLRPGEKATVICLACDRAQAKIPLRYIIGGFETSPVLRSMIRGEPTQHGIELSNDVEIIVQTNDFRAVRGRTVACAILDEASFYANEDAASSDVEVYAALLPALARLPNSMLVVISSVWKRTGLLYSKWAAHFGKSDDNVLVIHGDTRTFNPTIPQRTIDEAMARDPERARSEWLSVWRDDLATFLSRDLVESAVDSGVLVRPPDKKTRYAAFCDASGGRHDSFTAGVAHREGDLVVLDLLYERRAPFNPTDAVAEISELIKGYRCAEIVGDRYSAGFVVDAFGKFGIRYRNSQRDRSAIYADALALFASGRARLVENPRVVNQFCALERRTFATGRERIDHGPNGADDACNAAAGALTLAAERRQFSKIESLVA